MGRVAAVTGASGFLGGHLVRSLADQGWSVRTLVRRDPILATSPGVEPEIVVGDVRDEGALLRLCRGAEVLIHAAGLIKASSAAEFASVNVEGARRAAEAARAAGVPRVILVSSLAAREPGLSDYAASKREGEAAAVEVLGEQLRIMRPPAIYGPGDLETLGIFEAAARAPFLPVFDSRARIALIHVEDAARQIAAAADQPPARRIVALSDARAEGYTWREIAAAALAAVGRQPRLVSAPPALLTLAGMAGALQRRLGGAPLMGPGKARELRHLDWGLGPEDRWESAPTPTYGLVDGFAQTVVAWRRRGRLL